MIPYAKQYFHHCPAMSTLAPPLSNAMASSAFPEPAAKCSAVIPNWNVDQNNGAL